MVGEFLLNDFLMSALIFWLIVVLIALLLRFIVW